MTQGLSIGLDIGGTGIKAGIVNVHTGELVSERVKVATPAGAKPESVVAATQSLLSQLNAPENIPLGIAFPSIVVDVVTLLAANIDQSWIGLNAGQLFSTRLHREVTIINDADAAGVAEVAFGAGKDIPGLIIMTTLGTGIGSALFMDGVLIPNAELGHLTIGRHEAESWASNAVREKKQLSWKRWSRRLQEYFAELEMLFSPSLIIVGGGVSKYAEEFLPRLSLRTPIVAASFRNNAGIVGAARLSSRP